MADYFKRIQVQANKYEEVTDDEGPFIKIINVGERIIIHRIEGQLIVSGHVPKAE